MTSPTEISVSQLSRLIGTPDCPVIIDLRIDEDYNDAPTIIPSATRWRFDNIEALVPALTGKSAVIYCQKGLKISGAVKSLFSSAVTFTLF